jgi:integrase
MSRGHIRRQGKGSWELKYDLAFDPVTGRRQTRYATFRGVKREAEAELTRLLNQVDDGSHVEPSKETLADFAEYWLTAVAPIKAKSAKTLERYRELIDGHIIPHLGATRLQKLRGSKIDEFYLLLRTSGRKDGNGGLAEQTIIHIHCRLSALLSAAMKAGKVRTNPMERALAKPAARADDSREIRVLNDKERKTFLERIRGTAIHTPTLLALGTGLRRGEVLGLRWGDIDLEAGKLHVRKSLEQTKAHGTRLKDPKTNHSRRTISLPNMITTELRDHRKRLAEHFLKFGLGKPDLNLVFPAWDGGLRSPNAFSKEFVTISQDVGLRGITFHALRHTHITDLLRRGVSIKAVSARAGHKDATVTLRTYAHVMPGDDEELADITNTFLRDAVEG